VSTQLTSDANGLEFLKIRFNRASPKETLYATDQDLADITNWRTAQGLKIEEVGKGRLWTNFSGNVQRLDTRRIRSA
jgi:hypothetical protein